ncbi:sodium/glutamate symporter [Halodesulfovibrio sp. MK-HDV]|uniref:sodium/glutamate symporter n=1 Tax=unclassified Halodesulfovibrio TaxID=2644657 RepID=UPI00136A7A4C|nr:sodium/glutamate symporter [Halodesulfovibrio sp. MK-HDV]KAF1076344.1 hypothetical protein MKHDV_01373 [Halodesulfovibrio sp. MK-HDV]
MLGTYQGFMTLGVIGAMLLVGIFIRANIKIFQQYLVPAAILGGIAGFILVNSGMGDLSSESFLPFTMHAFNISFMSLCLTTSTSSKSSRKEYLRGSMWMTLIWTASFALQAAAGAAAIWGYNLFSPNFLDPAYGFLVTHGFTQGPGQGLAIGGMWENNFGLADTRVLGLIYANIGFIVAFIMGVPVARWVVGKNFNTNKKAKITEEFLRGIYTDKKKHAIGHETTHPSNIDTLAVHVAILGVAYFITYHWLSWAVPNLKDVPGIGTMCSWGFFFLHGLVVCLIIRFIMTKLGCVHLLDSGVQKHITSLSVDVMLVASFMSVKLSILTAYIVPILLVCIAATTVTFILIWTCGRKLKHLGPERMITQFGCCCGATANGLLLLRIVDPDYSTSVSMELAFFNVAIVVATFPMLCLLAPIIPSMSALTVMGCYLLYGVAAIIGIHFLGGLSFGKEKTALLPDAKVEA